MKKMYLILTCALVGLLSVSMTSCDDDDYWDDQYYFNLDEALNNYFDYFGDFGTDEQTTAEWFDQYYGYASDYDYQDFLDAVDDEIYASQVLMSSYLNGFWQGTLVMNYKDESGNSQSDTCNVTWDFELASGEKTSGRGQEIRYFTDENDTTNFSWQVNNEGGIEMSFDNGSDDPINMLVAYNTLDLLSTTEFIGTLVGVNIDETDDFSLTKVSYAKSMTRSEAGGKVFKGRTDKDSTITVKRNITHAAGRR